MTRPPILIVDDNQVNLKLARVLLEGEGFEIRTATTAQEAVASIVAAPPALILMDVQLPGTDGLELTRHLKSDAATRHITIVALTAYAMVGDEEKALAAGCDGYLAKPIDTRTLAQFIRASLNRTGTLP